MSDKSTVDLACDVMDQAAAELNRLRAENQRLMRLLQRWYEVGVLEDNKYSLACDTAEELR